MKKYLSLMLSIVLLLCTVIPVFATEEYVSSSALDKALIWHYDFEGDTLAVQGTDKSTGGQSTEVITTSEATFTNEDATIANGVASVTGSNGMNSYLQSTAGKKGSDYLNNATGEFTFLISFKLDGDDLTSGGFCDILKTSDSSIRIYTSTCNTTAKTVQLIVRATSSNNSTLAAGKKVADIKYSYKDTVVSDYINLAWTMKYNTTAAQWTHICYLSTDSGATYSKVLEENAADSATFFTGATWLSLGNKVAKRGDCTLHFDDFRIYNKALSLSEIKYEVPGVTGAVLHGVQTSNISDTYSVRFVGSIESKDYHEVGFKVTAQNGAYKWDVSAETVFSSLNANTDKGLESYTAKSLRGSDSGYLYALSINEIPTKDSGNDLTVTFIVTPYSIKNEGDDPVFGTAYTIVYKAGVYQSSAVYTAPTT